MVRVAPVEGARGGMCGGRESVKVAAWAREARRK